MPAEHWVLAFGYGTFGSLFVFWAKPLSLRYSAWITSFRDRRPNINPPPTPEWCARNTKIMTVAVRILGVIFLIQSITVLLPVFILKIVHT
jgi:hypothetical protein